MATLVTPVETGHVLGGRYRLGPRLGGGGMADVFAAEDGRLGRDVAVKVLRPEMASDEGIRRRFASEGQAAARLPHPNVVAVYDVGEERGNPFLVMELMRGGTLKDRMMAGALPLEVVRRMGLDILAGLGAAHRAGIVHRDVKPGNVLIGDDGTAKLADFGIAQIVDPPARADPTTTAMVMGTPGYLAPERAAGAPAATASDLWSVGVVLYEALTGVKPFQGPTPRAAALAARNGEYVALRDRRPDADPALTAAVRQALSPDRSARFASAAAMAKALRGRPGRATTRAPALLPRPAEDRDATAVFRPAPGETSGLTATQLADRQRRTGKTWVLFGAGSAVGLLVLLLTWAVATTGHEAVAHHPPIVPVTTTPPATASPQTSLAPVASPQTSLAPAASPKTSPPPTATTPQTSPPPTTATPQTSPPPTTATPQTSPPPASPAQPAGATAALPHRQGGGRAHKRSH